MSENHLSDQPVIQEYVRFEGQKVQLRGHEYELFIKTKQSRVGSYSRGLKWNTRVYGMLRRRSKTTSSQISVDHGLTWHDEWPDHGTSTVFKSKNKVIIRRDSQKEFAYEAIQAINHRWGY